LSYFSFFLHPSLSGCPVSTFFCNVFLHSATSRLALGLNLLPTQWVPGALFLRIKRPGRAADHLFPSSAEVNNCGVIPPLPLTSSWRGA
jgi:hypothetical protein